MKTPLPPNPFGPGGLLEVEPAHTIHPRSVDGRHARWRLALLALTQAVFYGVPWLQVGGQPAVLFDLEQRRFFLFGAVLFPQDLIWLALLLIVSALLLFFATALLGRVWCGFACPQTVYTALFTWIEHRCEGDRLARQRLDAAPWTLSKLRRRGLKHALWAAVSLWTGLTLVGWFTPMRELVPAALHAQLGPWEAFWTLFYGLATWGNAGFLREKVCQHMCPYARFQGSLMDAHTLNVSYDPRRGEPRGRVSQAQGACVDCTLCVQVCPAGIDIRQGLQSACINCGLCVDACDTVMDKLAQPRGLIRFESLHTLAQPAPVTGWAAPGGLWRRVLRALRRPRVLLYGGLLGVSVCTLVIGLAQRSTLRVDAMRDRSVMAREVLDDVGQPQVENVYRLLVMNASAQARTVHVSATSAAAGALTVVDAAPVPLAPAEARHLTVRLRAPLTALQAAGGAPGSALPITLQVRDGATDVATTPSTLWLPR
jgi:cytochrome c oxidase accessory protein FixG